MRILGIETSCDETAASVIEGNGDDIKVLSNIVSSQIDIHKKYGGVVPEIAAREHVLNMLPVINKALEKAGINRKDASKKINAIAVTVGPGLITSLIVGVETAKTLAYVWNLPIVVVNHIEGHIYANFVSECQNPNDPSDAKALVGKKFPIIILTVSGGHTMLVLMKGHGRFEIIGDTRDDAAGEAFDKAAKMMEIGYPGGPAIAAKAAKLRITNYLSSVALAKGDELQNKFNINLPRPMINSGNFEFSFSGLKTALLYKLKQDKEWKKHIPQYSFEFQQAVIDVLIAKTIKAAKKFNVKDIMLAGGVAANSELRRQMSEAAQKHIPDSQLHIPDLQYTTDNAAMIAAAGYYKASRKKFTPWQKLKADCNLGLK